jgi:hypothetical protein
MTRTRQAGSQQDTVRQFLTVLRTRGYAQTPHVPVTECGPGLTFVNATMTPFKPLLARGVALGKTCQQQECVRATGETPWLFSFTMVGALTDGTFLDEVCRDVTDAILAAMPWLSPGDLYALVDSRDDDLIDAMGLAARSAGIRLAPVTSPRTGTRWRYGDQFPLSGRGMTYVYRHQRPPCGDGCDADCGCGRWQGFGNMIVVEGPGTSYVEAGVGIESMRSTAYDGELYQLPEVRRACAALESQGYPPSSAAEIVNLRRTAELLLADGVRPGSRGGGYILRRFALRLAGTVRQDRDGDWEAAVRRVCEPGRLADTVIAEARRRERSHASRRAAAITYLKHQAVPGRVTPEELCQTFGLARQEASVLVSEMPH